ncbi:MAG: hypothetical protein HUJ92_05050 [Bacteroidales bacterium]|nr:hypothetical protein [Bacteroidales bacterium]
MMNKLFSDTEKGGTCTINMVNPTLNEILNENDHIYADLLYQLSQRQKELLIAIVKEGKAESITGGNFVKKHNLNTPSTIQSSISTLINKQIITRRDGKYEAYDKFFSLWIKSRLG